MIPRQVSMILKHLYRRPTWSCRFCTSTVPSQPDKANILPQHPASLFFRKDIQELLYTVTRLDYKRIFRARKDGVELVPPEYKFMTDDELKAALEEVKIKAKRRLHLPPVVMINKGEENDILAENDELEDFDTSKYVFTDISYGNTNKSRLIVVREPNGTLRRAKCRERQRINQIYFPIEGREIDIPKMFHPHYLQRLLTKGEYEFILDRACIQFEPNDTLYVKILNATHKHIHKTKNFDALRCTRHFGGLVMYLICQNDIQPLLLDILQSDHIEEAVALVQLYYEFYPALKPTDEASLDKHGIELVKQFTETVLQKDAEVTKAIRLREMLQEKKKEVQEGIIKAHGFDGETVNT